MLCFGPITREYLRQDTDDDLKVTASAVENEQTYTMIFKNS